MVSLAVTNSAVIVYAVGQCLSAEPQAWSELGNLVVSDRTYFSSLCVDLPLFAIFQPMMLSRVKDNNALDLIDYVPVVGLLNWMFSKDEDR